MKKYKFSLHVQFFHGCNQQRRTPQHHWPKRLHQKTHQVLVFRCRCGSNLFYRSNLYLICTFHCTWMLHTLVGFWNDIICGSHPLQLPTWWVCMQDTENDGPETACQPQIWHRPIRGRPSALCPHISYHCESKSEKKKSWLQTMVRTKKGLHQEICTETLGIVRTSPNNETVI